MSKNTITRILFCALLVVACAQLIVAHTLSTSGIEVTKIENERIRLLLENEQLQEKIASASSLLTISQKAKNLGFISARHTFIEKSPVAYHDSIQ